MHVGDIDRNQSTHSDRWGYNINETQEGDGIILAYGLVHVSDINYVWQTLVALLGRIWNTKNPD